MAPAKQLTELSSNQTCATNFEKKKNHILHSARDDYSPDFTTKEGGTVPLKISQLLQEKGNTPNNYQ